MTVNKYIAKKKSAVEALNEIDAFVEKMEKFMERHPEYSYKVLITKNENNQDIYKWIIELNVHKNE